MDFSIETIAREYNKQDGDALVRSVVLSKADPYKDAAMKVSLDILRRVYDALQDQGNLGEAEELLDPDSHLYFIDAFEMPSWHWSQERGTFEKCVRVMTCFQLWISFQSRSSSSLTVAGSADSRIAAVRNRLHIIKQSILRNEHFSPSTLPSRDREHLVTVLNNLILIA